MRQGINGVQVGRVGNGHGHLAFGFVNGDDAIFPGDIAGHHGNEIVLNLHGGKMHHFGAEVRGLGLRHVAGANDLVGHEKIHHAHAGGVGFFACLGDLTGIGKAEVNQQVQQIIVFFSHEIFVRAPLLLDSGG